jgi:preprotein translocase subunit SecE
MATLTKDTDSTGGNAGARPLGAADATLPARTPAGRNPPKYPQERRPGNLPATGGAGGSPSGPSGPRQPLVASGSGGGFFSIHKKGQGYWTRMGTVAGAALIGALTIQFVYSERSTFRMTDGVAVIVCALFAAAYSLAAFYAMNKTSHVDFLIATDSEMKKVNWTTRAELIGSTKVVILFMFIIAAYLFVMDVFFGYFFWFLGVLKDAPL